MTFLIQIALGIWVGSLLFSVVISVARLMASILLTALAAILWSAAHVLEGFVWLWKTAFEEE